MKFKTSLFIILLAAMITAACSDDDDNSMTPALPVAPEVQPPVQRIDVDCVELANDLATDFSTFCADNAAYASTTQPSDGSFAMTGMMTVADDTQLPVTLTATKDSYGKLQSITITPEDSEESLSLWKYCLENAQTLQLGNFLGTKYRGATEGGVLQTVEETLQYVTDHGTDNLLMCPVFGIVSGKAYAVPTLDNGSCSIRLMENYLTLDYTVAASWIGTDYQAFANEHYILGNKMSLWGSNYVYFDYALDMAGNAFSVDVNGDSESAVITSVKASLDYEKYDAATQLDVWKSYAEGDPVLSLGTFKEAYRKSAFGGSADLFDDAAAAVAYVSEHGRPGAFDPDVVVVYENGAHTVTITLKSLYTYVEVK